MICHKRRQRTHHVLARHRFEGLEARIVLSSIIATDPAKNSVLSSSPTQIRVFFDSPIDGFSLGYNDVVVDHVADDGSLSHAFADGSTPYESLDDSGTQLSVDALQALKPGHYRLVVPGSSGLAGLDGSPVANADGSDLTLGDFFVTRKGVGLNDAQLVGKIGSSIVSVGGSLDFSANPSAVSLYKITLAPGHFWRLGAEVSAERDGSSLNAAIALFDAKGQPIATDDVGRPDAPNDPFLFYGLQPGDYYIGVSGTGDLPGLPRGYDPIAQTSGPEQSQKGGNFTLHLVADEADLPGELIRFSTNHADPLDTTPTGFTLRFSTPLDLGVSGADVFKRSSNKIQIVGEDGKTWPVAAVNYDAEHSTLAFLFREKMPVGAYSIRMNAQNPLRDLAGLVPITPNMPKGVLATFRVLPDQRTVGIDGVLAIPKNLLDAKFGQVSKTQDLGPLTPNDVLKGITTTFTLQPGESLDLRFVSLHKDLYKLTETHSDSNLSIATEGGGIECKFLNGSIGQENAKPTQLEIGQYIVRFTADGDRPVTVTAGISIANFSWDSLLANGLGQGPALNLRLVATDSATSFALGDTATVAATSTPSPSDSTGPSAGPFAPTTGSTATLSPQQVSTAPAPTGSVASSSSGSSSGLPFEIGGVLVGRPGRDADHVAAVGPVETGSLALALGGSNLGQSTDSMAYLRGLISPSGKATIKPRRKAAEPILNGAMPPEAREAEAKTEEQDKALPVAIAAGSEADLEIEETVTLEDGSALVFAANRAESEEAEASPSKATWIVGALGIAALGTRWLMRKRGLSVKAVAPSTRIGIAGQAIPAPHARRGVRLAKARV